MATEDIEILVNDEKIKVQEFEMLDMEKDLPPRQAVNLRLSPLAIKNLIKTKLQLDKKTESPFQEALIKELDELTKSDSNYNISLIKMDHNFIFALIPPGILKEKSILFFFQIRTWIEFQIKKLLIQHYPDNSVCYKDIALGGVIGGPGRKFLYDYFFSGSPYQHSFCIWKLPGEEHLIIEDPRDGIIDWGLEVIRSFIYPRPSGFWPFDKIFSRKLQNILDDEYCSVAAVGMFFKALDATQDVVKYMYTSKLRHSIQRPELESQSVKGFEIISIAEERYYSHLPSSSSDIFNKVYEQFTLESLGLQFERLELKDDILDRYARELSKQSKLRLKKELPSLIGSQCGFFSFTEAKKKTLRIMQTTEFAEEQDDSLVKRIS